MYWIIAALSLAQVAQGLVPEVGESQTGVAKAALKTFLQHSGVRETVQATTGSTLPDLDHQGIMHGELLPPQDLNGRRLHTTRVRKPRAESKPRSRDERKPRGKNSLTADAAALKGAEDDDTTMDLDLFADYPTMGVPMGAEDDDMMMDLDLYANYPTMGDAGAPVMGIDDPGVDMMADDDDTEVELDTADQGAIVEDPEDEEAIPTEEANTTVIESASNTGGFTQRGDLTYYGGAGENGACSQTFVPAGFTTVAINQAQWKGGAECGTCVEGCFTNDFDDSGERCFKAIVDNLCPECASGDLDMGEDNGGRWALQWKFIDCPSGDLKLLTEGGNKWYAKLKVQGGPSSVTSMKCDYSGKSVDGAFTDDGFFEFWDRTPKTFSCTGMSCSLSFSRGGSGSIEISPADLGSNC